MELVDRRRDVAYVVAEYGVSERRACKLLGMDRSSYRYEPQPDRNAPLRQELIALARQRPRYGYRRLGALLSRRGYRVNHKRLYRLYREEHLAVRRLRRKRLARPAVPIAELSRAWREDYNEQRPHSALGYLAPREFAAALGARA